MVGGVKIGQNIGDSIIVYAGTRGVYTLFEGDPIGKSFITRSPEKSASELKPSDVETVEISLDKDYLEVSGGVIFRLNNAEITLAYSQTVLGRNIPRIHTASATTAFSIPNITDGGNEE